MKKSYSVIAVIAILMCCGCGRVRNCYECVIVGDAPRTVKTLCGGEPHDRSVIEDSRGSVEIWYYYDRKIGGSFDLYAFTLVDGLVVRTEKH